jgi:adenine-specific DNA-methyltransferase
MTATTQHEMTTVANRRARLVELLRELLQLNQPDLDFGLYRIMNARSAEIERFLADDLLRIVEEEFTESAEKRAQATKAAYEATLAQAKEFGVPDPEGSPKVKEAKAVYDAALAAGGDETDVYDHLYRFFDRYYDEGDFLSRRYYARETADRAAPYAVPYDGSEVYFHWANKDQYYIKTTENFRAFTFDAASAVDDLQQRLFAEAETPLRVHLHVVDAAEGEHNNVEADEGKDRFYVIDETPIEWEGDELVVRFQYRHDPEKGRSHAGKWRETRNEEAAESVLDALREDEQPQAAAYRRVLTREVRRGKDGQQPLLLRYVARFTARNTMDYFIHKDLGGFLRRELDFYVKNEVMRLDDLEAADVPRVESYLAKVRVLRKIAHAVIDFLAQTEDFQKRLWLKKKFVVETQYCLTLDRVPEALYPEIADNDAQREEWVRLFAIDAIEQDLTSPGSSAPLTVDFLKANPFLVLDTALFNKDFKARLLAEVENLDEQCDGVLIRSENFQGLRLISEKYRDSVDCTYIDPPYNTEHDRQTGKFIYKDSFAHSSWASMMADRLACCSRLLTPSGILYQSIGDDELANTLRIIEGVGYRNLGVIVWKRTRTGGHLSNTINKVTDYVVAADKFASEQRLFGGTPDASESQPLTKSTNTLKELVFPPGSVEFRDLRNGVIEAGERGTKQSPLTVLETVRVSEGRNETPLAAEAPFIWTQDYLDAQLSEGARIIIKKQANFLPRFLREAVTAKPVPSLAADDFSVGTNEDGSDVIEDLFGDRSLMSYPKPVKLLERLVMTKAYFKADMTVLDFFAGSGTTAHAVININRNPDFNLKYILSDFGDHFESVAIPRLKKVVYSERWNDSKPVDRAGVSHCFKYLRLESYEDTLNNLVLADDEAAKQRQRAVADSEGLRHDYWLRYWLKLETRGSASLLSAEHFTDPDGYWLTVKRPGSDEQTPQRVDLIETFNWLLGLHVTRLHAPETFALDFERPADPDLPGEDNTRLAVKGALEPAEEGPWRLRAVEGWVAKTPGSDIERRDVLVVWRTLTGDVEQDDAVLEAYLRERLDVDLERADGAPYEVIYVNGSPTLPKGEGVEVRPLEPEFHRRMWDTQDA